MNSSTPTGSNNDLTILLPSLTAAGAIAPKHADHGSVTQSLGAALFSPCALNSNLALPSLAAMLKLSLLFSLSKPSSLLGFTIMLTELVGFKASLPTTLHVDNKATVDSAHSEKLSKESRFMAMRLLWLREMVRNSLVHIRHVATDDNHSDIFTKISPAHKDIAFRATLMGTAAPTVLLAHFGT
jgi:hypothetical protein